ncbi:NAD(P)-dependent oxidoreductase [Deinococcus oregonensis]|uniref:NAD(P)-dependent oxidoreductase n=1 Tax=Deinococcus oregonensis TaxID=1805970 RepID=A0ABV6AZM3_9DEIO
MNVAVLGLGAMGSRVARRLLSGGLSVTVYNRSPSVAHALEAEGARRAETAKQAAEGADIVIAMVTDDAASRAVWDGDEGALAGLTPGAAALESSTLTPTRMRELAVQIGARGGHFLDAPVVGSRPQAEAGQLIFLVGGDAQVLAQVQPILQHLSAAVHHVGQVGQGTAMKLAVNALFAVQVAALGELLGLLRVAGIEEARTAQVLGALPVMSPAAKGGLTSMVARDFTPLFLVRLVEKDLGYATGEARALGTDLPLTSAVREVFVRAVNAGSGSQYLTAVAQLFA